MSELHYPRSYEEGIKANQAPIPAQTEVWSQKPIYAPAPVAGIRSYEAECLLRNGRLPTHSFNPDLERNQWSPELAVSDIDRPPKAEFTFLSTSTKAGLQLLLIYLAIFYVTRDHLWTSFSVAILVLYVFYMRHIGDHCEDPWCAIVVQTGLSMMWFIFLFCLFQSVRYRLTSATSISAIVHKLLGLLLEAILKRGGYEKGEMNWIGHIIFKTLEKEAEERFSVRDSQRMNRVLDKLRFLLL